MKFSDFSILSCVFRISMKISFAITWIHESFISQCTCDYRCLQHFRLILESFESSDAEQEKKEELFARKLILSTSDPPTMNMQKHKRLKTTHSVSVRATSQCLNFG